MDRSCSCECCCLAQTGTLYPRPLVYEHRVAPDGMDTRRCGRVCEAIDHGAHAPSRFSTRRDRHI